MKKIKFITFQNNRKHHSMYYNSVTHNRCTDKFIWDLIIVNVYIIDKICIIGKI